MPHDRPRGCLFRPDESIWREATLCYAGGSLIAWFECHEQIRDELKIHRLADTLQIPYTQAAGICVCLWAWACGNQRNGLLKNLSEVELMRVCCLKELPSTPAETLKHALKSCGLIDRYDRIANWQKYGVKLLESNRKAKARWRNSSHDGQMTEILPSSPTDQPYHTNQPDLSNQPNTKAEQPHQTLINRFLDLKAVDRSDKEAVSESYRRYSKTALSLIKQAGGIGKALAALERGAAQFDAKSLTWTLETIAKHLPNLLSDRPAVTSNRGLQALANVDAEMTTRGVE